MLRMRWYVLLLPLLLTTCGCETSPAPETTATSLPSYETPPALIAAMHDRYDGQWYETLTFVQETIQYHQDGVADTATWYEAYDAPGRLRIDFAPLEAGNGILFADDMRYTIQDGTVADARPQVHPLLLLGFDVYHLPAEETMRKLQELGFDMTKMYETTWQDRPTYVVGAGDENEKAATFWIDRENLYFTRMIRYSGPDTSNVQEVQFNRYQRLGDGWIAPEVVFHFDENPVLKESYSEMQTGMTLDTTLFNPSHWRATHWR